MNPCFYCGDTSLPCSEMGFDPEWCSTRAGVVDADNTVLPAPQPEGEEPVDLFTALARFADEEEA